MNKSVKQFDGSRPARNRRATVAVHLEEQLRSGTKVIKGSQKNEFVEFTGYEALQEKDRKIITKELETIKSRI